VAGMKVERQGALARDYEGGLTLALSEALLSLRGRRQSAKSSSLRITSA
jgi:hypothetical protein